MCLGFRFTGMCNVAEDYLPMTRIEEMGGSAISAGQ